MFEITWWCVVVSVLLGAAVGLDARQNGSPWRLPALAWAILVGVTWVGVVPYAVLRMRSPAKVGSR